MTNNDKYKSALKYLGDKKIYAGIERLSSGEIINLYIVDYLLSRNKLMEDIKGIVGDDFNVSYLSNNGEIVIQLKK